MRMKNLFRVAFALLLAGALQLPLSAQAPTALNFETTLDLDDDLRSTVMPTFQPAVRTALESGALRLRQNIRFDPGSSTLHVLHFTVQPNAPIPTTDLSSVTNSLVSQYTIKVDQIFTSTTPYPSVLMVGSVSSNVLRDPFGDLAGALAALSIGYTTATPRTLNNAVLVIAGRVVSTMAAPTGTITFPSGGTTPPPTTDAPTVNITEIPPTTLNFVTLDASTSTSPATGALQYSWRVISGAGSISDPAAATTTAYLLGRSGTYTFEVTVTDAAGRSSSRQVAVTKF